MDKTMVSIFCLAYNHEKYIRKMLDSLVCQKTNFKYEIVVHDDASTDHTADIIREYENKYPDLMRPIYQSENQYSKGISVFRTYSIPKCQGKYIAFCEGDDYWDDDGKLQKQIDILERFPECTISLHQVGIVTEEGKKTGQSFPRYKEIETGVIKKEDFLSLVVYTRTLLYLQFQLSGCVIRRQNLIDYVENTPYFATIADVGDLPLFLYMGLKGDMYYLEDTMSYYRQGVAGSWNLRNNSIEKRIKHLQVECNVLKEFDKYSNHIIHDSVEKGIANRMFGIYRIKRDIKGMKQKSMREYYQKLSLKERIKEHIKAWLSIKNNR